MRDEDLRQEFDLLLQPIREAAPPGMPAIKQRLRRRRIRLAAVSGTAATAAAAVALVAFSLTATSPQTSAAASMSTGPAGNTHTSVQPRLGPDGWQESASYAFSVPIRNVVVNDDMGAVTIVGSNRANVSVTERVDLPASTQPHMVRSVSGGTLTLTFTCQGQSGCSVGNCDSCGVNYVIQAPAGTAVNVTDDLGAVDVSGLSGVITATDSLGDIKATDLASRSIDLTADLGNITVDCVTPPATLRANDSEGNISIAVPAGVSYHVSTSASLGSVSVNVPQSNPAENSIVAQDELGNITISPDR